MPSGTSGGRTVAQVATPSHTALLVLALLIVSARGAMTRPMASWPASLSEPGERALLYAGIVGLQVSWTVYVWFGVRRAGGLRALIDQAPWTLARWVRYAAIGFAGFVFWLAFQGALGLVLRPTKEQLDGVAAMLPHKSGERLLWIGFALSAGMCEEVIYRGYLMRQFTAFSGHWQVGLLVQAAIYTCSHVVLPLPMVVAAALLGVLLGVIALWQKSLVPGMIIHTGTGLMPILASLASG